MKPRTAHTYGKRRVYTRLAHMIDPLLLAGIDAFAARSARSRSEVIRNAIYTSMHQALKGGATLMEAPIIPYAAEYENAPRLRLVAGHLRMADEYGMPTDEDVGSALREGAV